MKLIKKSKKLNNVLYDIRGPIVDRAKEMEAQGQQLIKLNIGNLASFDFQVPEEIQRDMILNLPNSAGYSDSKGIFADEVYDKILYEDAKHIAIASLSTDVLTITFNSLSKAYRACGYRAGWMIISGNKLPARDFIEGLNMLANMKLCANVPGQWAIQTALGGYQSINDLVCEGGRLRVQRDLAWELLTQIPGVTCVKPQGSLYMFPRLDPKIYPIENDRQFFKELLEATRVLLVQGTGFNWPHPDHFRVVFLPHEPQLREAISRIAEYLAAWRAAHPVKEEPATPRKKEGAAE